jgi:hypothetical protein
MLWHTQAPGCFGDKRYKGMEGFIARSMRRRRCLTRMRSTAGRYRRCQAITAHSIDLRNRKAGIVPAAAKSEVLTRRPDGRLWSLIRGTAVRNLAGTEEWSAP